MKNYLLIMILTVFSQVVLAKEFPDLSVYNLKDKWKTHQSKEIQLSNFSGHPVLIAMVYTSCQHTCPMITQKVKQIRNSLPVDQQNKVFYVLASFDTKRDTPMVLAAYKKKQKLDDRWALITSNELGVRKLAGVLGVNYKKTPDGEFSHSNVVSLLDQNGVLLSKIERLNQDDSSLRENLKTLAEGSK